MRGALASRYSSTVTPWSTANPARAASAVSGRTPMPTTMKSAWRLSPFFSVTPCPQGHSVVVDAVFANEIERVAIQDAARKLNIRFVGLFLVTDLATRLDRVGHRELDASDATPEIAEIQEKYDIGAIDWTIIDASGTPGETLEQCQTRIAGSI
jgi:hypothetical protein